MDQNKFDALDGLTIHLLTEDGKRALCSDKPWVPPRDDTAELLRQKGTVFKQCQACAYAGRMIAKTRLPKRKLVRDMTEPELTDFCKHVGRQVEAILPPANDQGDKTMFALLFWDSKGPGVGQYLSNCERKSMIDALFEVAHRLKTNEDLRRDLET